MTSLILPNMEQKTYIRRNYQGAEALDSSGNRYRITAHYGGEGLPVPEIINLTLISRPRFSVLPVQRFISFTWSEFVDQGFVVVKPLEKV